MTKITRFTPKSNLLSSFTEDLNRLLYPFSNVDDNSAMYRAMTDWQPNIDVLDNKNEFIVHVDLPGVKLEDIEVDIDAERILTIQGKREIEKKQEEEGYLRVERAKGSFMRQMRLPETVDPENIKAKCKDGVLEVILPKKKRTNSTKIKVEGE